MVSILAAYVVALVVFAVADFVWLSLTAHRLYHATLGDLLAPAIRFAPAIAFYLLYPAGLVLFVVAPALNGGTLWTVALYGALFGLFTYATYDLTNFATLRNWTLQLTLIDIGWGAILAAMTSTATFLAVRRLFW